MLMSPPTAAAVLVAFLATPICAAPVQSGVDIVGVPYSAVVAALETTTTTTNNATAAAEQEPPDWLRTVFSDARALDAKRHQHHGRGRRSWWYGGNGYAGLWNIIGNALGYDAFDSRFDGYTAAMAAINSASLLQWQSAYGPRPTGQDLAVPTVKQDVPGVQCGLAENVVVPETDEDFGDTSAYLVFASSAIAQELSFPETASDCGEWSDSESSADRTRLVKDNLMGGWPSWRVYVPWGDGRDSDAALSQLVFQGFGQHRITRVKPVAEDPHATGDAYYAVYLGVASSFEVRPGFARLGADAYFDRHGNVLKIVRLGHVFYPDGPQGSERACTRRFVWRWSFWKRLPGWETTCTEAEVGWKNAKMAFRGTLHAVVTTVDHLYGIHLSVANAIVTANVEELEPDHPLRRLLTPHGFHTEAINYQASFALVNEAGLIHRSSPLSLAGMKQLFSYARSASAGVVWSSIPARRKAQGVDTMTLPLEEDGLPFYEVCRSYVATYLHKHYGDGAGYHPADRNGQDACQRDAGMVAWHARTNAIAPNSDLPALSCVAMEEILATTIYLISAGHTHTGALASEVEDPCFAPWAWREGEQCGTPRAFLTQALTFALTSLEQPLISEDMSHIFLDAEDKQMWSDFTTALGTLDKQVDARNAQRERPFRSFDVDVMEAGVGI